MDLRPPVPQKPLTASAIALLELYYRLNVFVMATEERAPVEWVAEHLGRAKARAYAILREIDAHADLEAWFRQKVLSGMERGRIGRGRETRPSPLADAFFVAMAGGVPEAMSCVRCLAGNARADLQAAADDDHDEAASEVRDYMVHSRLLWRLSAEQGIAATSAIAPKRFLPNNLTQRRKEMLESESLVDRPGIRFFSIRLYVSFPYPTLRLLPEMKQPKGWRRVSRALPR